jgi:hypothetical protein
MGDCRGDPVATADGPRLIQCAASYLCAAHRCVPERYVEATSVTTDGLSPLWIALRSDTRTRLDERSTPPASIKRLGEKVCGDLFH